MKKKVIVALASVLIGHVGVLFAISHMKVSELKKIDKEPLKVRFLQIKEDAPPPPPPPSDPVKPKVQPKPEPKVVEPPPVVKPKIIAEKPKPKVEKAKPVVDTQDQQRREQERLEQQRQQQERLEQQQREQQKQREQQQREQQAREQAERDRLERERTAENNGPRDLSAGQISWSRSPKPSYTNSDLKGSDRTVVVSIEADTNGSVVNVSIVRSSGIDALDQKILRVVRGAKFKPYKKNGVAYPFKVQQPFELKLNSNG